MGNIMSKGILITVVALLALPAAANAATASEIAQHHARVDFRHRTGERIAHSHAACKRRTSQVWWRCKAEVDSKRQHAVYRLRVHRSSYRVVIVQVIL